MVIYIGDVWKIFSLSTMIGASLKNLLNYIGVKLPGGFSFG